MAREGFTRGYFFVQIHHGTRERVQVDFYFIFCTVEGEGGVG
jgi:hypothetical protein